METACLKDSNWIQNLIENVIAPLIVASVAYFLFNMLDELKKRKNYSKLGVAILDTLIEEVTNGRDTIRKVLNPADRSTPNHLPSKSWSGINTITDEVLLRIFEVSKNVKDVGFPARHIRNHTKNYFDFMVPNFEQVIDVADNGGDFKSAAISFWTYDQAATGVLDMLVHVRSLLEKNTKRIWPK
jgi:hypothetical protein